jgi:hypothetical protein
MADGAAPGAANSAVLGTLVKSGLFWEKFNHVKVKLFDIWTRDKKESEQKKTEKNAKYRKKFFLKIILTDMKSYNKEYF